MRERGMEAEGREEDGRGKRRREGREEGGIGKGKRRIGMVRYENGEEERKGKRRGERRWDGEGDSSDSISGGMSGGDRISGGMSGGDSSISTTCFANNSASCHPRSE